MAAPSRTHDSRTPDGNVTSQGVEVPVRPVSFKRSETRVFNKTNHDRYTHGTSLPGFAFCVVHATQPLRSDRRVPSPYSVESLIPKYWSPCLSLVSSGRSLRTDRVEGDTDS